MLALAKKEGIELTDEQLEAVSGGYDNPDEPLKCPKCKSEDIQTGAFLGDYGTERKCNQCGCV